MIDIEQKYAALMEKFKADSAVSIQEAVDAIHSDMLPHIENDTLMNVDFRAQEAVNNLISGRFDRVSNDHVSVALHSGIHVSIKITANQFDSVRKSLIEVMGTCPKDLEIEELKERIKFIENNRSY